MTSSSQRYPLSSPEGTAIPLEVIKPISLIRKSFTSAGASASVSIASLDNILLMHASKDCIIRFAGEATLPADGVVANNTLLLLADSYIYVFPPALSLTVIGITEAGTLSIQSIETWVGLAIQAQLNKRY